MANLKHSDVAWVFLQRVYEPQAIFLLSLVGGMMAGIALHEIIGGFFPLPLLATAFGFAAYHIDVKLFRLVPTLYPSSDHWFFAQAVATVSGIVIGLLAVLSCLSLHAAICFFFVIAAVKLGVPSVFAFLAYGDFKEHVYPIMVRHENDKEAYDRDLTEETETVTARKRAESTRREAIQEARQKVFIYFNQHRHQLLPDVNDAWLYSACRAEIPDDATDDRAFAGAAALLTKLQQHVRESQDEVQAGRVRDEQLDADIHALRQAITEVPANPAFADDPASQRAEVTALQRKIEELARRKRQGARQ